MQQILLPGFSGAELPSWVAARLRSGLPGICLYGDNIESREQLKALCTAIREANPRAIIAIDEEGGDVTRLFYKEGSPYPGNAILGRLDDLALTAGVATAVANDLRAIGVNLNLAPVVDINSEPKNPVIGVRSFGADPELVSRHGAAWSGALQSAGVAACAKHFPGHGDTVADSHLDLPVVHANAETVRNREMRPFLGQIEANVAAIMTSHIVVPALEPEVPATLSKVIITEVLKEELGFTGVVITDALDMKGASGEIGIPEAAVRSLAAGCDLLLTGPAQTDEDLQAIEGTLANAVADPILAERYEDALLRIQELTDNLAAVSSGAVISATLPSSQGIFGVFEVSQHAKQVLSNGGGSVTWIELTSSANMAIGHVPWGPAVVRDGVLHVNSSQQIAELLSAESAKEQGLLVACGRNILQSEAKREIADAVSKAGGIVVDMAAVTPETGIDILTFGASKAVSLALVDYVESELKTL